MDLPESCETAYRSRWADLERRVSQLVPALRARFQLETGPHACAHDVARALERIQTVLPTYDGKPDLASWALEQARMAVEEGLVETLRQEQSGAALDYCREGLARGLDTAYRGYYCSPSELVRRQHLRLAEATVREQLATFDGSTPFHVVIRRVVRLDKEFDRRGMNGLSDWLGMHAQTVVDHYVVEQVLADSRSVLPMVIWQRIARQVSQWYDCLPGAVIDPSRDFDVICSSMLAKVPPQWHDRIVEHTDEINTKVLRGLSGFKFESSLGTWLYSIVRRAMITISEQERRSGVVDSLDAPQYDEDGECRSQPRQVADGRQDLGFHDTLLDIRDIANQVLHKVFGDDEVMTRVINLRLEGMQAKDIEQRTGIAHEEVHRIFSRFCNKCKEVLRAAQ